VGLNARPGSARGVQPRMGEIVQAAGAHDVSAIVMGLARSRRPALDAAWERLQRGRPARPPADARHPATPR
jgi:hypothetical protein